jgi:hypothetical protein
MGEQPTSEVLEKFDYLSKFGIARAPEQILQE